MGRLTIKLASFWLLFLTTSTAAKIVPDDTSITYTGLWTQSMDADPRYAPIQGIFFTVLWEDIEPVKDMFEWSDFDKKLLDMTELNLGISLRPYTG